MVVKFDITLLLPELVQLAIILALFLQSLAKPRPGESGTAVAANTGWVPWAAAAGLALTAFSLGATGRLFWEVYQIDGLSQFFKFAVALGFASAVLNASRQPSLAPDKRQS